MARRFFAVHNQILGCTAALLALTVIGAGCGSGGGSGGSGVPTFKVTLAYATLPPMVGCNDGTPAHIHPGWHSFEQLMATVSGGQTTYTSDVPVGNQRFVFMDPGACTGTNAWGSVTSGVTANGVPLTSVVPVDRSIMSPAPPTTLNGLSFTVLPDGTIKP
jgi:hypothetical protein